MVAKWTGRFLPTNGRRLVLTGKTEKAQVFSDEAANPDANSALGYDAMYVLANAIKRAGSLDRKAIRDQIAATKDYQGVSGVITMGPDRDPIKPVAMIKIDGGTTHFAGWIQP
jgi:branched-chain amino acid transport system substrate-binding protein